MTSPDLGAAIECVLFVGNEPISGERLAEILGVPPERIPELMGELQDRLVQRGLCVVKIAGGYNLATRPEYAQFVERLLEPTPERLSVPALEALAIIAYREPITRPEIDELRGVNSSGVVNTLIEKGLVTIAGRKDAPGRPFLLRTTPHFLASFGLCDLDELPRLDEVEARQLARGLAESAQQRLEDTEEETLSSPAEEAEQAP